MWNNKKVSVVFPAYNEEENIAGAINDFFCTGVVDEIVVINNNSKDRTEENILKTRAILVNEPMQGYGYALRRGLREATGDYIITSEPDGTFMGRDVLKLLAYAEDFEMVCGTRTTKELIWHEANMQWFLRLGNIIVAKLMELLYGGPSLSDCGCTMRLIQRNALYKFIDKLSVGRSHFLPEMVILALKGNISIIEIPVNYKKRVGESKITGSLKGTMVTGVNMLRLILSNKFKRIDTK